MNIVDWNRKTYFQVTDRKILSIYFTFLSWSDKVWQKISFVVIYVYVILLMYFSRTNISDKTLNNN